MTAQRRRVHQVSDIDFFLAGPGHSGTTWLCSVLRSHPSIFIPPESNFLTWNHGRRHVQEFFGANEADVFGEHGNNYWSFERVPEKIASINRAAKIVAVVQDPIGRIIRNYRHDRMYGVVPHYFSLEIMLQENFFRSRYILPSRYADNLERWLNRFPPEQIFLYWADEGDTSSALQKLFAFLKVAPFAPPDVDQRRNVSVFPWLPLLHRHAVFGENGLSRSLARVVDPLNCWVGKTAVGPPAITETDLAESKALLGDQATLDPLRAMAKEHGVQGNI